MSMIVTVSSLEETILMEELDNNNTLLREVVAINLKDKHPKAFSREWETSSSKETEATVVLETIRPRMASPSIDSSNNSNSNNSITNRIKDSSSNNNM